MFLGTSSTVGFSPVGARLATYCCCLLSRWQPCGCICPEHVGGNILSQSVRKSLRLNKNGVLPAIVFILNAFRFVRIPNMCRSKMPDSFFFGFQIRAETDHMNIHWWLRLDPIPLINKVLLRYCKGLPEIFFAVFNIDSLATAVTTLGGEAVEIKCIRCDEVTTICQSQKVGSNPLRRKCNHCVGKYFSCQCDCASVSYLVTTRWTSYRSSDHRRVMLLTG